MTAARGARFSTGWMDGWMDGLPAFLEMERSRSLGPFIARHDVLVVGRFFASAHHHSPQRHLLSYFHFFFLLLLFFFLDPNEKFHTARHATDDLFLSARSHSFFSFFFDFIIPKVTALGARTTATTTFYLMS